MLELTHIRPVTMGSDTTPAWIAATAGMLAAAGSYVLLFLGWRRDQREGWGMPTVHWEPDEHDPKQYAQEAAEASERIGLYVSPRRGPDRFVATNLGPGVATITDLELTEYPGRAKDITPPLPLPVDLAKDESHRFPAVMGFDELPTPLRISWRDNRRRTQHRTVTLTH